MSGLVSIIVPVFNSADTVEKCINSILNQTYQNIELLIIDDGSSDASVDICNRFAEQDSRCKVFHIENRGVANARNYGLSVANGEFIQFVDSDDWIKPNCTAKLVQAMDSGVDLVVASYIKVYIGYLVWQRNLEKPGEYSSKEYLINTLKDPGHFYYGVNWNKLYRHSTIVENNLAYASDITLGEDFVFNLYYVSCASQVKVIKDRLYYYNCTKAGLSRGAHEGYLRTESELNNRHIIWKHYVNRFTEEGLIDKYLKKMQLYWIRYKIRQEYHLRFLYTDWNRTDLNLWSKMINDDLVIKECVSGISLSKYSWMRRCFFVSQYIKDLVKKIMRLLFGKGLE